MAYPAKKTPLVGSFTASVSLALIAHGALLLLVIGFTIERVSRPKSLTDAPESLNSVLLQEPAEDVKAAEPHRENRAPAEAVKVAVAIPSVETTPAPESDTFHARPSDEILPTRTMGNPAPVKLPVATAASPAPKSNQVAAEKADAPAGPGSGVVAFTNVKGDSAKRIVYVIDGSGSMTLCLPFIRSELLRSVARLDESQSFQIVVFRDPPPGSRATGTFVLNPRKTSQTTLLAANDLNKSILRDWLETVQPVGRSTPLSGIENALALQPDLIFLLSRGIKRSGIADVDASNRALLDRLEALNPVNPVTRKRRTVIKALQFIDDDPTGLMQSIGKVHGDSTDSYKVIPVPERYRSGELSAPRSRQSAGPLEKN